MRSLTSNMPDLEHRNICCHSQRVKLGSLALTSSVVCHTLSLQFVGGPVQRLLLRTLWARHEDFCRHFLRTKLSVDSVCDLVFSPLLVWQSGPPFDAACSLACARQMRFPSSVWRAWNNANSCFVSSF
ncbi:hypothetical protein MARPO_0058s0066 [Marchantia polymorpha]|uniref:Uncharacterized protein n=1 Tax=Marchantia polymorpha TaxID=3197 RepID=A0A2R6WTU6_MARPO|nr:hypothetical protein MARPO_0058s0066 [Marchantia polymorpha]|eukprot:PTQ37280.1 hypothetical protein MARPO_0058s0066 [Marchantia polymorpha]